MHIIGAGKMAREYARVLSALGQPIVIVGNTYEYTRETKDYLDQEGIDASVYCGGISGYNKIINEAIIAVPVEKLYWCARAVLGRKAKKILLEKPGCLYSIQARRLLSDAKGAEIHIAYNRRYYNTVKMIKAIIQEEGVEKIELVIGDEINYKLHPEVSNRWLIANTSHCLDVALYLTDWRTLNVISNEGNKYEGYIGGIHYYADWNKNKRWKIKIYTTKDEYTLEPLEKLWKGNEIICEEHGEFKHGLYAMVKSWLEGKTELPTLQEQVNNLKMYERIGNL